MNNEKIRAIPMRNYIILGVIILVSFLFIYYLYLWFDNYKETKLNMPILDRYMEVINYNELGDYLIENPDSIIYVSVLENSDIREFEKKVKDIYRKNMIENEILYMDITNDIGKIDSNSYSFGGYSILDVPVVMVFDNGILKSLYSVSKNDYDIDRFKNYINDITFSNEGEIDG